jgi:hypothetical protein
MYTIRTTVLALLFCATSSSGSTPAMVGPQWEAVQKIATLSFLPGQWKGLSTTFDENKKVVLRQDVSRSVNEQAGNSSLLISDELEAQLGPEATAVLERAGRSRKQRQSAFINYDVQDKQLLLVVGGNVSSVAHTLGRTLLLPISVQPGQVIQWKQESDEVYHLLAVHGDEMIQTTTQRSSSGLTYTSREIRLRRVR